MVRGFEKAIKGTVVFVITWGLILWQDLLNTSQDLTAVGFDIQSKEVRCGGFQRRTKEQHTQHVQTALSCPDHTPSYGVKKTLCTF